MLEKKLSKEQKSFLIKSLRRASLWWPPKNQAKKLARIKRGLYLCKICQNGFKYKQVSADHIEPVVSPKDGFNVTDFVLRLLCPIEGYQILCKECHDKKTKTENQMRKDVRKSKNKRVLRKTSRNRTKRRT